MRTLPILMIGFLLAIPAPGESHQLDEYLQATRLALSVRRVVLEIDLTPGVNVARRIFALIDENGDGELSAAEREKYARQVLNDVTLQVDGARQGIALAAARFPSREELHAGVGTIRLEAEADVPSVPPGHHQIFYRNNHQADIGVFLVNALVPAVKRIEIVAQRRDTLQRETRLEYLITSDPTYRRLLFFMTLGLAALVGIRYHPARTSYPAANRKM